jgi:hypothetical protein
LPAFRSSDAYRRFADEVKHKTRYIRRSHAEEFLQTLLDEGRKRVETIHVHDIVYRAQLDCDAEIDGEPAPFSADRMKPLKYQVSEGRANPKGIPHLYVSTDRDTALAEVHGSVALSHSLNSKSDAQVNCTEDAKRHNSRTGTPPEYWDTNVWCDIDAAFSRPLIPTNETAEYVPTQVMAEVFKVNGYDGVAYRSALGTGLNVVLFDIEVADFHGSAVFELKRFQFDFRQCSNPYVV